MFFACFLNFVCPLSLLTVYSPPFYLLFSMNKEQTKEIKSSIEDEGKKNRDQTVETGKNLEIAVVSAKDEIIEKTATKEDLVGLEERLGEKVANAVAHSMKKAKEEDIVDKTDGIKPTNLKFDGEDDNNTQVSTLDSSSAAETECEEKPGGFRKVFASAKKVKLPFSRMNGRE